MSPGRRPPQSRLGRYAIVSRIRWLVQALQQLDEGALIAGAQGADRVRLGRVRRGPGRRLSVRSPVRGAACEATLPWERLRCRDRCFITASPFIHRIILRMGFEVASIASPILFVQGGEDRVVPRAHADWLVQHAPSSELWFRPRDGHNSVLNAIPVA